MMKHKFPLFVYNTNILRRCIVYINMYRYIYTVKQKVIKQYLMIILTFPFTIQSRKAK